ncbi:TraX family protein [Pseudomonas chlororaphis]|uniref:Conjugal transfer protein TraX n=1 Tax=Pseudomonas chlororaphis TaxID=587753 RepID=A0A1Q8EGU3_9PSED|nr:TraX family protein [Pseudomonas chlororaphis]OLF51037.1 conjugal transfer protein TraX [Pseudomonas chlororaphis]
MPDPIPTPIAARREGALDLLKWLALLCMLLDHLRYVGWSLDGLYVPGRLAFPWFCLALAANVARAGAADREGAGQWRYLGWLLLFSLLSEVPYRLFIPDPDTLNVLPTLALGLLVARAWQRPSGPTLWLGVGAGLLGGLFDRQLMFGLFGVLLPLALLLALQRRWYWALLPGLLCLAANQWESLLPAARQGNQLAAWALGVCLLAPGLGLLVLRRLREVSVPPMRRWAYLLYPGHFLLLLALRNLLA